MRQVSLVLIAAIGTISCQELHGPEAMPDSPQTEIVDAARTKGSTS